MSFILALSCPRAYATEFRYGLNITVKAADGSPICDANVIATEGSYPETLQPLTVQCTYVGAGERAGNYRIEVERTGFMKAVVSDVLVEAGECHVMGTAKEIVLQPE